MIQNNQRLPAALQPHVQKKAQELGLKVPDPKSQKPTPPHLQGHPSTHAMQMLQNDDIPKEIVDAAKAAWGGGGATQTINVHNPGVSVSQTQGVVCAPPFESLK